MRGSRFKEEQIIAILRDQESGMKTAEICRKHGISSATYYIYGRLSRCKRLEKFCRSTWVPTSIRRHQGCWRAQMGNPRGVSLNKWAASMSRYRSQVPHAPVTSAGTLL
jgi:hypothetical protein